MIAIALGLVVAGALPVASAIRRGHRAVAAHPVGRRSTVLVHAAAVSADPAAAVGPVGLEEALEADLAASSGLRVLSRAGLLDEETAVHRPPNASAVALCNASATDFVVLLRDGAGGARATAKLYDCSSGEVVLETSTSDGDPTGQAARVGGMVRRALAMPPASADETAAVRAALPHSDEAWRAYANGVALARRAEWSRAAEALRDAAGAAPESPNVHLALAIAWDKLGFALRARDEATRVVDLGATLPPAERAAVRARALVLAQDPGALDAARAAVQAFPDDVDGALRLASLLGAKGDAVGDQSSLSGIRALPSPLSRDARVDVADAEMAEGRPDWAVMAASTALASTKAAGLWRSVRVGACAAAGGAGACEAFARR